jgi:hypothetical protein
MGGPAKRFVGKRRCLKPRALHFIGLLLSERSDAA